MKLRVVARKLCKYVREDLKEIAFPSSLPDPPGTKKRRKLTWIERWYVLKEASRLYAAGWVRDIGPDLRPDHYKKMREQSGNTSSDSKEPSLLEDLAVAAGGGSETLKPALQRIYMARASAYKDSLKHFIEGYQQGLKQTLQVCNLRKMTSLIQRNLSDVSLQRKYISGILPVRSFLVASYDF